MQFLNSGKIMFDDIYELYYHLFIELGLSINSNGYLYDQDNESILAFKDKYIKATVSADTPVYAGKNDIIFAPEENYTMINFLFGYFLDKIANDPDITFDYKAHFIEDNPEKDKQRLVIRTGTCDYATQFYYNLYLGFIEAVFIINQNFDPDLSNFDIIKFKN